MKEEKQAKTEQKEKEIIILDKGIITADDPGPQFACCGWFYFPLRG